MQRVKEGNEAGITEETEDTIEMPAKKLKASIKEELRYQSLKLKQ